MESMYHLHVKDSKAVGDNQRRNKSSPTVNKLKTSRVRRSLNRYAQAKSIHEAKERKNSMQSDDIKPDESSEVHKSSHPNIAKVNVPHFQHVAPVLNVYLGDGFKAPLGALEKSSEALSKESEKKIQKEMNNMISKVGDSEAISKFKTYYSQYVNKEGKVISIKLEKKACFLHEAAQYGNLEIAKFLIEKNHDPNLVSKSLWTPLQLC